MVLKRPKNRNTPKNGWTKKFYSPKDSKKGKIFEIGSPEVWEKAGGGGGATAQGLHYNASSHVVHQEFLKYLIIKRLKCNLNYCLQNPWQNNKTPRAKCLFHKYGTAYGKRSHEPCKPFSGRLVFGVIFKRFLLFCHVL